LLKAIAKRSFLKTLKEFLLKFRVKFEISTSFSDRPNNVKLAVFTLKIFIAEAHFCTKSILLSR